MGTAVAPGGRGVGCKVVGTGVGAAVVVVVGVAVLGIGVGGTPVVVVGA